MGEAGEDPVLRAAQTDATLDEIKKLSGRLDRLAKKLDDQKETTAADLVYEALESLADARRAYLRRQPPRVSPFLRRAVEKAKAVGR